MSDQLEKRLDDHDYEIRELRSNIKDLVGVVKESTQSMNNLAQQFAVYTAKHDSIQEDLKEVKETQKETSAIVQLHSQEFAAMRPVVDGLSGIVWKIVGAFILASGGVATAVVSMAGKVTS